MKHFGLLIVCILVGAAGWRIGGGLSPDALGMAVGILFGVMAGIPTALLMLAAQRRPDGHSEREQRPQRPRVEPVAPPQIVQNHYHYHAAPGRSRQAEVEQRHALPEPRQYRVIGQEDGRPWT